LSAFAKYVEILRMYGINVIFLHVPTLEVLSNWHDPTMEDYQNADAKLQQYGIKAASPEDKSKPAGVYLVLLGSKDALAQVGVSSLPTAIGSKDSKECLRHVGEEALQALNLSNPDTLTNVLKIFNESTDDKDTDDSSKKGDDKKSRAKKGKGGTAKKSGDSKKASVRSGVDRISASKATQLLNEGRSLDSLSEPGRHHSSSGCSCRLH
jgi:hypothetical protein